MTANLTAPQAAFSKVAINPSSKHQNRREAIHIKGRAVFVLHVLRGKDLLRHFRVSRRLVRDLRHHLIVVYLKRDLSQLDEICPLIQMPAAATRDVNAMRVKI